MWAALAKMAKEIRLQADDHANPWYKKSSKEPVDITLSVGHEVTITKCNNDDCYELWGPGGWIWQVPKEYIGEIIHVYSNS